MKYLIIDWMNLLKRYSYRIDNDDIGNAVSIVAIQLLNKIAYMIENHKPDLVFACSDTGRNKRAIAINSDYKGNRGRMKTQSEEEKEKNYMEFLKEVIKTLPILFVEFPDIEADMIIAVIARYLQDIDSFADIDIASSDADFIQLLNNHVKIFDHDKNIYTNENWTKKYKLDYSIDPKYYALMKSIIGDKSDNIAGIKGLGWSKISKLFNMLQNRYNSVDINNIKDLLVYMDTMLKENNLDTKTKKFLMNMYTILSIDINIKMIQSNQKIIDLSLLENPWIFKILNFMDSISPSDIQFDNKRLYELLHFSLFCDAETADIFFKKNARSCSTFSYLNYKSTNAINKLQKMKTRS